MVDVKADSGMVQTFFCSYSEITIQTKSDTVTGTSSFKQEYLFENMIEPFESMSRQTTKPANGEKGSPNKMVFCFMFCSELEETANESRKHRFSGRFYAVTGSLSLPA